MELRPYQRECIETIEAQAPGAYLAQMATGSREKGALKHTFALRKSSEEFERRLAEQRSTILQTTETAITRYRKERTLEAADALADAVDGVLI